MKRLIQLNLLLLLISSASAQDSQPQKPLPPESQIILRDYDWKDLAKQQALPGEVITMDGSSVLKIETTNDTILRDNTEAPPQQISLLKISDPSVIRKTYFLVCEVKTKGVFGFENKQSSLSLMCSLPPATFGGDGRTIDAKTINNSIGTIYGTSKWRSIQFAVDRNAIEGLPTHLELHLEMLGRGTIYLRPIRLYGVAGSWWSPEQTSLIGGIGGSLIGCFGALLGILASKGKARNFVLTTMKIFIVLGILLTIAGFVAVMSKQPYAVWYALLLPGVILTLVFSLNLPSIQRRYDELEIRRMTSVDTMGS
jgi:hypothetical protein